MRGLWYLAGVVATMFSLHLTWVQISLTITQLTKLTFPAQKGKKNAGA